MIKLIAPRHADQPAKDSVGWYHKILERMLEQVYIL
jgi:hypothetical protein